MSLIKSIVNSKTSVFAKPLHDSDIVCSSYLDFNNPTYAIIDGTYFGSLMVINYSREMEKMFLDKITSMDLDIQISIVYKKQNSYEVIKELTYNIGNTGATVKTVNQNQQDIDIVGSKYSDAKLIRKELQLGEENLFFLTIYMGAFAKTSEALEQTLQRIESVAVSMGLTTIRGNFRQEQLLKELMPFLKTDKSIDSICERNVLTSGLIATYPFSSNELFDKNGVLIGTNTFDKSIIMLDRFDTEKYKNANMFVVGTSGSGKSYFVKVMINRNRFLDISQYVIDPDREYTQICEKLGGTLIKFGATQTINIFDIRPTSLDDGESYLLNKVSKLKTFFSMLFENITEEELAKLEELIIKVYYTKGITEDNNSLYVINKDSKLLGKKQFLDSTKMPILGDLYELIKKEKSIKKYATILKQYVSGSLKYLNNYTNIDIDNKLVVADIHDISEKEMPIIMFIVTDYFWDEIRFDRTRKKILYLDEVWKLINKNEKCADFVFKLFKTIRKYGGGATAITQDISDFFMLDDGKYGRGILNNSSVKAIFQLEENDISLLEKVLKISEEEKYKLLNMKRGTTIMHAGRNILMVDVVASQKEHEYISTDYVTN